MPYKMTKVGGGKYRVTGPSGVHAKGTTKAKAEAQIRIMQAEEHDPGLMSRRKVVKSKGGKKK